MVCSGCGHVVPPLDPRPFRCPNSGSDDADHVLRRHFNATSELRDAFFDGEPDPFIRYRRLTHAWNTAMAKGMTDDDFVAIVRRLEQRIGEADAKGFCATPLVHHDDLWIKDETVNVAGSHKGRHLMGLMIWLEIMDLRESRLAIASCGNAALAAAVVARAAGRALDVFVPADASQDVLRRLESLGAHVTRCARQPGVTGDPAYHRFREAVADGALPFTCQGNENGMVIEGGQTLAWEIVSQLLAAEGTIDRLFVQVGGGALASACIASFEDARALGLIDHMPRIHAVQTAASPLMRAWERVSDLEYAIQHRSQFMWPWETAPASVAHGILDDETYDWAAVMRGMTDSDGFPITVSEDQLIEANHCGRRLGFPVSATGSAGLAGILELKRRGAIRAGESLGVLFTG
jgi:threonine synthase